MAYYLLIRYHVNGGTIANPPSSYSSGVTSYSSVTASSSSTYKYFRVNSSSQVTGATSSGGTYGVVGSRFTASSTSTNCNLVDRATFDVTRTGYHLDTDEEYRAGSTSGNVVSQYGGNASKNMPTISRLGGSTSANKTVTVYYNWKANTYIIYYSANGGTWPGSTPTTSATYDSNVKFSSTTPTRTGYLFLGWSSSSTATSATWTAGQTTTTPPNLTSTDGGTVTVYAVWQANTYTVTYNANGGSGVPGNQTATYNSALTLSSSSIPTRIGYTFLGWSTSSTATSATYTAGQALTAAQVNTLVSGLSNGDTRTLYAVWQANIYIKVNGTWKPSTPYIKVNGTWKPVTNIYTKVDGIWKS